MLSRKLTQAFGRLRKHHIPFLLVGSISILVSVGLVLTLLEKDVPATSGNIYLAKADMDIQKGSEARFDIRITPGAKIDTVTATARYDASKMAFKSAMYTSSPFTSQIPAMVQPGVVTIQAAKLGGQTVEDDAFVATLLFTAVVSGNTKLELTDGNAAWAGSATNPTVNYKIVSRSSTTGVEGVGPMSQSSPSGSNGNRSGDDFIGTITKPLSTLLGAIGVAPRAAKTGALWLGGLLLCLLVIATLIIVRVTRFKKGDNKEVQGHEQTTIA